MEEHDLLLIYDGEWTLVQDQTSYTLCAGDMILLRAGSHHLSALPCSPNTKTMFIHFNRLADDQSNVQLSAVEASSFAEGPFVCLPTVTHCDTGIDDIIDAFWSRRDDRVRRINMLFNILLTELAFLSRKSPVMAEQQDWIYTLLDAMNAEPRRFFTLQDAAELVNMSTRTISTRFQKVMGTSFHQYQTDKKLQMAFSTLGSGTYTVKQVSEMYGFCDPYYFSRVFKKHFGLSPKDVKHKNPATNIDRPWMQ
jgi:AraC-like DNA-binding protein